jgi:hypothetical protein
MGLRSGLSTGSVLMSILVSAGCTSFSQTYHFQSEPAANGVPNFFRVRVEGDAQTVRARFLAGFYDERAVDLFFNELKSSDKDIRKLFEDNQKAPGEDTVIKPLTPDRSRGTFVMIFSTNPKAVADTIGNFAESQVVADSITNLVNKRDIEAARQLTAGAATAAKTADAVFDELAALLPANSDTPPPADALKRSCLRALEAMARQTGGPQSLASFDAAKAWLGRVSK